MTTLMQVQQEVEKQAFVSPNFDVNDRKALLEHAVVGLVEEAGEVAGLLKRLRYQNKQVAHERWIDELGDVMWYLALAAEASGTNLEQVWQYNLKKLEARYGLIGQVK